MVLKIERFESADDVVLVVSGKVETIHLAELQSQLAAQRKRTVLDMKDVTLVERDVVDTLARWEKQGIELRNCPAYVREWLDERRRG